MPGTVEELEAHIESGQISFDPDKPNLEKELLGTSSGTNATAKLQELVVKLADTAKIRISSIIRTGGHHATGRAVDIGNEDIAGALLPTAVTKIAAWNIDEIIFDAGGATLVLRNKWNYDQGVKHSYNAATLDQHKDHIHFAVTS